jgi:hypothetical protein
VPGSRVVWRRQGSARLDNTGTPPYPAPNTWAIRWPALRAWDKEGPHAPVPCSVFPRPRAKHYPPPPPAWPSRAPACQQGVNRVCLGYMGWWWRRRQGPPVGGQTLPAPGGVSFCVPVWVLPRVGLGGTHGTQIRVLATAYSTVSTIFLVVR